MHNTRRVFALTLCVVAPLVYANPTRTEGLSNCGANLGKGAVCTCRVSELRPTQPTLGMLEVRRLEERSIDRLKQDMARPDHEAQVVVTTGGRLYIVDGHHHSRALYDEDRQATTTCRIAENDQALDPARPDFWSRMQDKHHAWLRGPHGEPAIPPDALGELQDYRQRTLAGWIKDFLEDECGIHMSGDFAQFRWADALRDAAVPLPSALRYDAVPSSTSTYPSGRDRDDYAKSALQQLFKSDFQDSGGLRHTDEYKGAQRCPAATASGDR